MSIEDLKSILENLEKNFFSAFYGQSDLLIDFVASLMVYKALAIFGFEERVLLTVGVDVTDWARDERERERDNVMFTRHFVVKLNFPFAKKYSTFFTD